jgi:hypothetical protein
LNFLQFLMILTKVKKTVEFFTIFDDTDKGEEDSRIFYDFITLAVPSLAATRWVVLSSIHEVTEAPDKEKKKNMVLKHI